MARFTHATEWSVITHVAFRNRRVRARLADETSPRPPARRSSAGVPRSVAAFGRFWPLFSWPRKATPEPDFAVFWPFRAGFGLAAAAANRGPHGGGAHAARGSVGGGDSVPSAGRVWGAVFSWAMEGTIGIGHGLCLGAVRRRKFRGTEGQFYQMYMYLSISNFICMHSCIRRVLVAVPLVTRAGCSPGCSRTGLCPPLSTSRSTGPRSSAAVRFTHPTGRQAAGS